MGEVVELLSGDLFAMLAGIDGECFVLRKDRFRVRPGLQGITSAEHEILDKLCVLGTTFRTLEVFVDTQLTENAGIYRTAVADALDTVLDTYREEILLAQDKFNAGHETALSNLVYRFNHYFVLFPLLANTMEEITHRQLSGCRLLSFLHDRLDQPPDLRGPFALLMRECLRVFLQHVADWVVYGTLSDHRGDFFVQRISDSRQKQGDAYRGVWDDYDLNAKQLLSSISKRTHVRMLELGLYTLLLQGGSPTSGAQGISEDEQRELEQTILSLLSDSGLDAVHLDQTLAHIHERLSEHVWRLLMQQADLVATLQLVKDMFLLGKGDFFVAFLEEATDALTGPITSKSSAEVQSCFENAFVEVGLDKSPLMSMFTVDVDQARSSARLAVDAARMRMMRFAQPLQVLFTNAVLTRYDAVFRFLLKLRVTQHALDLCWKKQMKSRRHQSSAEHTTMWIVRSHMAHIVTSLQSYIHSDVLEAEFGELLRAIQKRASLTSILDHHARFLDNIARRTFQSMDKVTSEIDTLLNTCLDFHHLLTRYPSPGLVPRDQVTAVAERFYKIMAFLVPVLMTVKDRHLSQLLLRVDFNQHFSLMRRP
ncbi:hypothetical protein PTSG_03961 [Salpingoeca rosetta]|uniref:Spindle pole body component n=1 Tax=Salpingoeca rosetta (strain ATCC 50818 / BSB-021) TaxID=946362 RepID=F2U7D6_SALR5|nr:uncharacterized protein PTSG_03961 [Salpingoeca rosetta]EGD83353.1 hypothetical protein PTSG_03961 [Salpingoeca rosetta]|eukprot:XP_004994857.1 hypothetical protein PTSG_03961 [Salpingoeca rosetta]